MCTDFVQGVFICDFLFEQFICCHTYIKFGIFSLRANSCNVWMFYLVYASERNVQ